MKISNTQRVIKLLSNLAKNPKYISPYVKHNFINKRLPIDLNMPWWSYKAIEFVDTIVENKNIFEFGTGGSTLRYSKLSNSIVSVEDNLSWLEIVKERLLNNGVENVEIMYEFYDFKNGKNFEQSDYLKSFDKNSDKYDIIIIDGQDETFKERIKCFKYVESKVKVGSYIIVDDFWRYEELLSCNRAKEIKVFESVGPCRYGVTSTAVFLY